MDLEMENEPKTNHSDKFAPKTESYQMGFETEYSLSI